MAPRHAATPARRVATLAICCLFMVLLGSLYAFSSFSKDLQSWGFENVPTLGSYGNVGSYCGALFTGALLDRIGSRRTTVVALALAAGGWLGLRYALGGAPSPAPLALSLMSVGLAGSTGYMAASAACYALFEPSAAGRIHGLLLAAYSLSAVVWAPVYAWAFAGRGLPSSSPGSAAPEGLTLTGLPGFAYVMAACSAAVGAAVAAIVVNHKTAGGAGAAGGGGGAPSSSPSPASSTTSAAGAVAAAECPCTAEAGAGGSGSAAPQPPPHPHTHPSHLLRIKAPTAPSASSSSSSPSTAAGAAGAAASGSGDDHLAGVDERTPLPQGEVRPADHHPHAPGDDPEAAGAGGAAPAPPSRAPAAPFAGYPLAVLLLPCLVLRHRGRGGHSRHQDAEHEEADHEHEGEQGAAAPHPPGGGAPGAAHADGGGPATLAQALVGTGVLAAQFAAAFTTIGGALVFLNSISLSLHAAMPAADDGGAGATAANELVANAVLTFALANTLTRLAGGWAVDALAARGRSRLHLYLLSAGGVLGGLATAVRAPVAGLLPAAALVGVGDGAAFSVWPCTVLDLYGRARYGTFFAVVNSALGLGSLALSAMASANYRARGEAVAPGGKVVCHDVGGGCYTPTWVATACLVALVGLPSIGALLLHERARARGGGGGGAAPGRRRG